GAAWLSAGETTYHYADGRWAEERLLHEHETLLAVTAWDDDRAIAAIAVPGNDLRLVLAGGKPGATLPVPSPADAQNARAHAPAAGEGAEADEKEAPCKVRMKPRAVVLAGLPGGQLYAAGHACEPTGHGDAIVERWEPG